MCGDKDILLLADGQKRPEGWAMMDFCNTDDRFPDVPTDWNGTDI